MPPGFNAFSSAPSMAMQAGGGPAPPFGTPPGMNPYMMQQQGMPFQQQHRPLPPGPGAQTYWRPPVGQQQPTGINDLPPQHLAPVGPTLTSQSGTTPSGVDAGASPDAGTDLAHDLDGLQISGQPKAEAGAAQPVIEKGKGKEDKQVEGGSGGKTQGAGKALTVGSGGQSKPGVLAEKAEPTEPVTSVPGGSRPNRQQQVQQQEGRIDDGQISGRETALDNDQQNEAPVNGSGEANARLPGVGAHLLQSNRRGGGRGGRGRGGFGPRGNRIVIPDQDYDFESANAKFNKTDVAQEAGKDEKSPTAIEGEQAPSDDGEDLESPTTFYKKSSFFDDISCESKDRADGDR
ncbi:hypothetical protein HK097_005563 [Rhizophlyctis rosea]|uniref:Uncharacterized protein n=1 Tax=Rhizophlyctis rosea TaxID=64517 RepID=A0AAD5X8X5_9FUNG|nr:hypothetical protein HK097_005563 [Rhizophlyctis rosea]